MVSLLLVKGSNVKAVDKREKSPLHLAAFMGKGGGVCEGCVNVWVYDDCIFIFDWSFMSGHRECINTLVGSGGDVNTKDKKVRQEAGVGEVGVSDGINLVFSLLALHPAAFRCCWWPGSCGETPSGTWS